MSKKISGVVALLIVVAVGITALGVLGIGWINDSTEQLGRLAARSVNLTVMDRIVQQRGAATLRMIVNTDSALIERNLTERFLPAEKAMEEELADYATNFPVDASEEMRQRPAEIRKRWDAYVAATAKIAEMARINSNSQASAAVHGREELWNNMDKDLAELLAAARGTEGKTRAWGSKLADARTDLAYYRMAVSQVIATESEERMRTFSDEARKRMNALYSVLKEGETLPGTFGVKARELSAFIADKGMPGMEEILRLASLNSNIRAMNMFRSEADPVFEALDAYTAKLETDAINGQEAALATARKLGSDVSRLSETGSAAGIVIAGILAYLVVSRIVRQLNRIIGGLDEASAQVASAAGAISEASEALAEGATEQAASLEETSSALEEMASMTRNNADNSARTAETTNHTGKLVGDGATSVNNMSQAMGEISDSAERIGNIIKTIEEIAFQTNLLALNAAVEAARAGDAGKGFAVVADEVRNLAQRSAQAARDTAALIEGAVTRVRNGSEMASDLDSSFKEIEGGARDVGKLVGEIAAATSEQAQGIDQVNTAVAQMDKVTQSNAAAAEECASASEELSGQAEGLKNMVENLVVLVTGARRNVSVPLPEPRALEMKKTVAGRRGIGGQRALPGSTSEKLLGERNIMRIIGCKTQPISTQ